MPTAVTEGRLSVVEYVVAPGFPGPPLHVHPDFDETFCVLEGNPSFVLDDEVSAGNPGDVVLIARAGARTRSPIPPTSP